MERGTPLRPSLLQSLLVGENRPLSRLEAVPVTGSTNDDVLRALAADPTSWPGNSLLVADHQTAGKGRVGRDWVTPAGAALTCTFVVHPAHVSHNIGWLPLLAGLAAVRAVRATAGVAAVLKWPNDVVVELRGVPDIEGWGYSRKLGGVLTQATPDRKAVAVGIGLNVLQTADELPVPSAASMRSVGAQAVDRESLLITLVAAIAELAGRWRHFNGDVAAAGLDVDVASECVTLGKRVQVTLPGNSTIVGQAVDLGEDGSLVISTPDGGWHEIHAGDVTHLRSA